MLAAGLLVLQIALGLACVGFLYGTVAPFVGASRPPEATLPEIVLPEPQAVDETALQVIQARNLFKTPASAAPAVAESEVLAESSLEFKLSGTAASQHPTASVAILTSVRQNESFVVRIGDALGTTGAKVERIEARRIVIENQGKIEQISLDEDHPLVSPLVKTGAAADNLAEVRNRREQRRQARQTAVDKARQAVATPPGRRRTRAGADEVDPASAARPAPPPEATPGPQFGEVFAPETLREVFPGLALQDGESVIAVNGKPISDAELGPELGNLPLRLTIQNPDGSIREEMVQ